MSKTGRKMELWETTARMARNRWFTSTLALGALIGVTAPFILDRSPDSSTAAHASKPGTALPDWVHSAVRHPVTVSPREAETRDVPPPAAPSPAVTGFLGSDERAIRESLRSADIVTIEKGHGGRSLSFKIALADGTVGYFKPEQTFSAAHWFSEVAAYYLDRALGFGRVPPALGRRFAWAPLRAAAGGDRRVSEIRPSTDGTVRGAFLWWIPGGLSPIRLGRAWERVVRIEGALGRTPYDRPAMVRDGTAGSEQGAMRELPPERASELSDLLIFDYLVQNVDRWGGDFTNVRARANDGPMVFLDNGAGFWPTSSACR
jgi:hypothetical protein